ARTTNSRLPLSSCEIEETPSGDSDVQPDKHVANDLAGREGLAGNLDAHGCAGAVGAIRAANAVLEPVDTNRVGSNCRTRLTVEEELDQGAGRRGQTADREVAGDHVLVRRVGRRRRR